MKWIRKGLIYHHSKSIGWKNNSSLQPTPFLFEDKVRIYVGFRDEKGVSRVGYIDLDRSDLNNIFKVSDTPVLDIGKPGMFDENGVVPTCVIKKENELYMYYAGYMVGLKVRMLAFTGLAISKDNGETFKRYKEAPITDRVDSEELFRVIHTVLYDEGKYKAWYGGGNYFLQGKKKTLPVYDIRYMESEDSINYPIKGQQVIPIKNKCYRVGRPYVFKENGIYKMYYGYGSEAEPYLLAYAESNDGINWEDKDINLPLSQEGWDSKMMAYPAFIRVNGKGYLFYNGNNYGYHGFGYAELIEE